MFANNCISADSFNYTEQPIDSTVDTHRVPLQPASGSRDSAPSRDCVQNVVGDRGGLLFDAAEFCSNLF
jgi:hypothetical protein